jgi:hypothetical protein
MQRLVLSSLGLLFCATPSFAGDLGGPAYSEREDYYERPAVVEKRIIERPAVVEKRVIEHHYYNTAPAYSAPEVYYAPRVYTTDAYYDRPYYAYRDRPYYGYRYAYNGYAPRYFFPRGHYWHRHHRW